jgi:hypothetical protein
MNYGELKAQFEGLLKRRDMTPTQSDTFLQQAISRTQRVLRVPPMEKSISITYDGVTFTGGQLPIPNDYLKLINITVNDEPEPLRGSDLASVLRLVKYSNGSVPTKYRSAWRLLGHRGTASRRRQVSHRLLHGVQFSLELDRQQLPDVSADDLVIYAALSYAGDWFVDKRAADWEAKFLRIKGEIEDMAATDELVNAQVSPAYFFPED